MCEWKNKLLHLVYMYVSTYVCKNTYKNAPQLFLQEFKYKLVYICMYVCKYLGMYLLFVWRKWQSVSSLGYKRVRCPVQIHPDSNEMEIKMKIEIEFCLFTSSVGKNFYQQQN